MNTSVLRIIDANINRAMEGIRVVEDFARFCLNDKHLAGEYKILRHELFAAISPISQAELFAARHTPGDVGTGISADDEYKRDSSASVASASQKRIEQALRCIEEYAKTIAPEVGVAVEQIRYRAYTLGKAIAATAASRRELDGKRVYVIIDGGDSVAAFEKLSRQLVEADVGLIQLRDKRLSDRELVDRGHRLHAITRSTETLFIVNDRPDIAVIVRADGVHVGQDELAVHDARAVLGVNRLVGVSTHSIDQARQAVLDGADYLGCGPTFPSRTKEFDSFPGTSFLQVVAAEISLPAFAIGGIGLDNLPIVIECGFRRVAVSNCVTSAEDAAVVVRGLRDLLA